MPPYTVIAVSPASRAVFLNEKDGDAGGADPTAGGSLRQAQDQHRDGERDDSQPTAVRHGLSARRPQVGASRRASAKWVRASARAPVCRSASPSW